MQYTALIVDLIDSQKIARQDREEIQTFIKLSLDTLNDLFKPSLEFELIFSAGDEIQGLFGSPVAAFLCSRLFRMLLAPVRIRSGLGVGELEVRIPDGTSAEQDGKAYHNARAALDTGYSVFIKSEPKDELYLNTIIGAAVLLAERQSTYQSQIYLLTELLFPLFEERLMERQAFGALAELFQNKLKRDVFTQGDRAVEKLKGIMLQPLEFEAIALSNLEFAHSLPKVWKKGISTQIANLIGTSRQNVDNIIKAGQIVEIRNIDATASLLIAETFGG
jgi:hypothetical protein